MKMMKKTAELTAFIFIFIILQITLSVNASAAMSAENITDKLGKYTSWAESISDGTAELTCPDHNIDEDYYSDMVNDIVENLKGEMGKDYCFVTIFVEYSADLYNSDMNSFKTEMFEIERHLNICWPEWSGRDGLNFMVGAFTYSDGTIAKFFVEAQLMINGQSEDSTYSDYNTQLKQIVNQAKNNDCSADMAKVKYYCDWIKSNIKYDLSEANTNSACEALYKKKAVCGGFANLLRDLCRESGITAIVPTSTSLNHAWNEVYIGGTWYTIDMLNVVRSKAGKYTDTYLFTDPDGACDYLEEVSKMKGKLYAFSFLCQDGLTFKINTNYDRLVITGKGDMQNFDCEETVPAWIDYLGFSEVYVASGVTSIGDYAFWDGWKSSGLTTVYLPSTITRIGEGAFGDCDTLTDIYFDGTENQWNRITKPDSFDTDTANVNFRFKEDTHVHSYGSWITSENPGCTTNGRKYKQCVICDDIIEESVPAIGHSYVHTVTQPTCTDNGYTTHRCRNCGDTYIDSYVSPDGHAMGQWQIVTAATCTNTGERQRKCNNCTHTETEAISKTAHIFSPQWTVDIAQTCTKSGEKSRHCIYCTAVTDVTPIAPDGHDYSSSVTAPTCTSGGYTTHTCHCGDSYTDNETPAKGHSFGEWIKTASPTCETSGSETRQCTICFRSETKNIDSLGHSYGADWVIDKEPTCTENGSKSHHCIRCESKRDVTVMEAEGHNHVSVVTPATCTTDGYTTHTCHCGDTYSSDYIYAEGHKEVIDKAVQATCTSIGLTEGKHCSVCNKVLVAQKVVDKINHNHIATTVQPTCTENGKTVYRCSCGDTYEELISAKGHSFSSDFTVDTEATCIATGSKSKHCANCDAVKDVTVIEKKAHEFVSTTYLPTCTEAGYTHNKCRNCAFEETADVQPATGHHFGEYASDENATCLENGTKTAVCDTCGVTDTVIDEGSAKGHSFSNDFTTDTEATCTTTGSKSRHCADCDAVTEVTVIEKKAHELDSTVYAPTCAQAGYTYKKCRNCAFEETADVQPATGHHFGEYASDENATCLENGTKTAVCDTCGVTDTITDEGSARGHTEVVVEGVEPTCSSEGLKEGLYCSECNTVIIERETIPQTDHIDKDNDNRCDYCDKEITEEAKCDCSCHKAGFVKFFYKIFKYLWKLFDINRVCSCGTYHY